MAQEVTYKWVQDRLRELHAGNISVDNRRQLEQLAQEDPFIADAIEGFESHPHYPHLRTLNHLATRIRPVKRERRRWLIPNLTVTAVAASLILIVGFWAVMTRINKDDTLAVTETSHEVILNPTDSTADAFAFEPGSPIDQTTQPEFESLSAKRAEDEALDGAIAKSSARKKQDAAESKQSSPGATSGQTSQRETGVMEEVAVTETQAAPAAAIPGQQAEAIVVQDDSKAAMQDPMYFANQMDPAILARRAAGRVISESGTPLIGANLSIRNTNLGTASDLDGKFELFLPAPESTVDITFSGYEGRSVKLKQGEDDVAILLPEVPVNRNTTKMQQAEQAGRSAAAGAQVNTNSSQPFEYSAYLRSASRYPLKDNLYTPGRDVTLKFEVTADGQPSRVRVVNSSNDRNLDEEALRLIRKGPNWVCEGGKYPCEMTYTIYFR